MKMGIIYHFWNNATHTSVCGTLTGGITVERSLVTCERCRKLLGIDTVSTAGVHFWNGATNDTSCGLGPDYAVLVTMEVRKVTCKKCRGILGLGPEKKAMKKVIIF